MKRCPRRGESRPLLLDVRTQVLLDEDHAGHPRLRRCREASEDVVRSGLEAKSAEFLERGGEIYVEVSGD